MFVDSHVNVIVCRPRTSETNSESERSSFLGFQACLEEGDGSDSMIVWCMFVISSLWYLYMHKCCNIENTVVNDIDELSFHEIMT